MTTRISRQAAGSLTVVLLVVALGGFVGVGALAIGGEGALPAPPPLPEPVQPAQTQSEQAETTPQLDIEELKWVISDYYNFEEDEAGVVEAPTEGTGQVVSGGPTPIRYLGSIIGPERRLAIVSIDGRQRILAESAEAGGYTLNRVEEDHIVVSRAREAPMEISKSPSDGNLVTKIAAPTNDDAGAAGAGVNREDLDNLTRNERIRQENIARQRERLGTFDERRAEIERRRTGLTGTSNPAGTYRTDDQEDDH